jgi:hypothetical protein
MKRILPIVFLTGFAALMLATGNEPSATEETGPAPWKLTADYSLKEPFSPEELRKLAAEPGKDDRRLMLLILRAGLEKDRSFQDLLQKPELRKHPSVALALFGYDYMLNQSPAALDFILAQLATEDVGADVDTIVVLQTLDEWDRTIRAFRKHFLHTDGAGSACKRGFLSTRAYLYPRKYAEMKDVIEAPIKWTEPLLPGK